jgi:hypothetical protein
MKLNVKAFGLACGIIWGGLMLILGLGAMMGWGEDVVNFISRIYVGYQASFLGAMIGLIWGFVDAFVGGVIFAWLYNKLAK